MLVEKAIAPSYATLRPLKSQKTSTFPVYPDLAGKLSAAKGFPDLTVAHVLAAASGYAYSDAETVAMIMARMGLDSNHCLMVGEYVDPMFIDSTAFLIQSQDGSVVILAYRGTQPMNLISWLTDADVYPDQISLPFDGPAEDLTMHAGFYRNVRSTRFEVVSALNRALKGRSILDDDRAGTLPGALPGGLPNGGSMEHAMSTLYVTGHSLGGAMAAIMSVMLAVEPEYQDNFSDVFRGGYTYGQPMIGSPALAAACAKHPFLGSRLIRYVYRRDVVPHLPPRDSDQFAHFGQEYHYEGSFPWKDTGRSPAQQMRNITGVVEAPMAFVARQFRLLRDIPFQYSLNDHGPQHYVSALTPPGVPNEFGDAYLVPHD